MDYREKYIKALEWMQSLYSGLHGATKEEAEHYFPELKESDGERIVRCLLNYFNHVRYNGLDLKGTDVDEVIAWLKTFKERMQPKQGEKKNINHIDIKEKAHQIAWETSKDYDPSLSKESWCEMAALDMASWLEKQGEKKPFDYENVNIQQKDFAPKVEPKFKVGDWITCKELNTARIINIEGDRYEVEFIDGSKGFPHIEWVDRNLHLWTIQDAKDGDVLVASDDSIFLFAGVDDCACKYYVALTTDNYLNINKEAKGGYWETSRAVYPATKNQRDTLFAKMKEAGYEWDADKKELKKN